MPKVHDDELVMSLVDMTVTQTVDAREAWLREACRGDEDLFHQVWDYVQWNHRMSDFLLEPLCAAFKEYRLEPGDLLMGRFRIIGEVGEGGMGVVYAADDEKLGRRIALKCARSGFRNLLGPEVLHASEISHPNICRIFEIHTTATPHGEIDFLTMEFLKGETLAARLSHGPIPDGEARAMARQICAGLAEAHRNRVVHGDLKGNNVILTRDAEGAPRAVITDFGLAQSPVGPEDEGEEGMAGGTPEYMAPELWKGEKPSAASDVYALGVMLYEVVAGRRPFPSDMPWQERMKHKPRPVGGPWDSILQKCLNPDPAKRYRDAAEVAAALEPSRAVWLWLGVVAAVVLAVVVGLVTNARANAPKESVTLAMVALEAGPDVSQVASEVSRDAAGALRRLKGDKRVRLTVAPLGDVNRATHEVNGTITREDGKVVAHVFLTDMKNQTHVGDWKAEYAPGEVHYAAAAITGMVTAALHLPPLEMPPVNAQARQNYLEGLKYTRRNSTVDKALPLLQSAVKADPDSPLTWAGLAEAQWFKYFIVRDAAWLDRTSESLRQAQNRDLDLAPVHRVAGLLRYKAGEYEQAEMEYNRAIEIDPGNADAYRRLGQAYFKNNRSAEALAEFKKAVQLQPNDFKTHQDLGAQYERSGDELAALSQFQICVQLAPDEPDAHRVLGTAFMYLGRYSEAEREFRSAVGLAEMPTALGDLGYTLMYLGRDRDAIPFLKRAIRQSPDESLWWMDLGIASHRAKMPDESEKAFRVGLELADKVMVLNPKDGDVRSRVAFLSASLGDPKRATTEIRQALQLSPDSTSTLGAAVWTYETLGMHDDALTILRSSPDEVVRDAARWPDLADLHGNPRFRELLASRHLNQKERGEKDNGR